MDVLFLFILSIATFHKVRADVKFYADGDWKPIIKGSNYRDYNENPNTQNERQWIQPSTIDNVVLGDLIEVIDPPDVTKRLTADTKYSTDLKVKSISTTDNDSVINDEEYYEAVNENSKHKPDLKPQQREGRKLNHDPNEFLNNKEYTKTENTYDINPQIFTKTEPNDLKDVLNNSYEVKEEINDDHALATDHNYFTNIAPKPQNVIFTDYKKNNLTSNFLNILANYNIRTSDKLVNYPLSLRQNSRNINNHHFPYTQLPLKIPLKYNNANHLPVDPLLAVFLSNYGHYVPGLFGFSRNYENLYGYLASNNIHNNKPFGPYKLFSDTDSAL